VFLEWVKRGGAGSVDPAPLWSELETWPASKQALSISPFIRYVNSYFRFAFAREEISLFSSRPSGPEELVLLLSD
jgi:hypothetical protein